MLSIGLTEIIFIAILAVVVVGPERLPQVMRQLGRWYGQLRRSADELRRAFVLEADRQDAEERYQRLRERRERAAEARKRALEEAGEGTHEQAQTLPPPDPEAVDLERVAPQERPVPTLEDDRSEPGTEAPTDGAEPVESA